MPLRPVPSLLTPQLLHWAHLGSPFVNRTVIRFFPLLERATDVYLTVRSETNIGHVGSWHVDGTNRPALVIDNQDTPRAVLGYVIELVRTKLYTVRPVIGVFIGSTRRKVVHARPHGTQTQLAALLDRERQYAPGQHLGNQQMCTVIRYHETIGVMNRVGYEGELSIRRKVYHRPGDWRLDVIEARVGEVDASVAVCAEIIGPGEWVACVVTFYDPHDFRIFVQLHERVFVRACNQQMILKGKDGSRPTMIAVPIYLHVVIVPGLDVVSRILHIEQATVVPQRRFRVMGICIDDPQARCCGLAEHPQGQTYEARPVDDPQES